MVAWTLACFVPFLRHMPDTWHPTAATWGLVPSRMEDGRSRMSRSRLEAVAANDIIPAVREGVAEAGIEDSWKESVAALAEAAAVDSEEAELFLANGLNWMAWAKASPMMRKYAKPVQPDTEKLKVSLQWLKEGPLELDQEQLQSAIRDSPKVYLTSPEDKYEKAIAAAPEQYKDPLAFRALLLKDPSVLDCYYNCDVADEGCASECGNCWVAYERR